MTLRADDRGQAMQIGAVILFGFLVVAFAGYQAISVPSQNQGVEFQHSLTVTDQMQEFRADTIEAASTGAARSQAFTLGTTYPARLFAVNPPPASGRLTTTTFGGGEYVLDAPGANLENICGLSRDGDSTYEVPSKALVYEPNYNEYTEAPDVVYENTVTYREFPGDVRLDSGQTLVDGTTITLTPLTGEVSDSTSATRTVDLSPGKAGVGSTENDDTVTYTLTVPTALDEDDWRDLLSDEPQVDSVSAVPDGVEITLDPAEYTVVCPPVGLRDTPENDPANVLMRSGDGASSLNPGDSGEVRLDGIRTLKKNDGEIALDFVNSGDPVNLSAARYNFYFNGQTGSGGPLPNSLDVVNTTSTNVVINDIQLRGETGTPESGTNLRFEGGGATTTVEIDLNDGVGNKDYFVLTLRYSDGEEALYFVDIP